MWIWVGDGWPPSDRPELSNWLQNLSFVTFCAYKRAKKHSFGGHKPVASGGREEKGPS